MCTVSCTTLGAADWHSNKRKPIIQFNYLIQPNKPKTMKKKRTLTVITDKTQKDLQIYAYAMTILYKSYKGIQSHELHAIREIFNVGSDFYKELIEIGLIKKIPTQGKQFVITKNSDNWPTIEEIRQCHQNQTDRVNKSKSKTEITENQLAKKEYAKEEVFMIIERIFEEKFNININELINFIQSTKP